ncbi:uncharacterized protein DMAD_01674 [Drosophila madeirensis]|uniref:Uncharacterized protein n=1 Tax=Drosophila madeirensis TaxID=30013 RepID=A0AAU9G1R6_DROMD
MIGKTLGSLDIERHNSLLQIASSPLRISGNIWRKRLELETKRLLIAPI